MINFQNSDAEASGEVMNDHTIIMSLLWQASLDEKQAFLWASILQFNFGFPRSGKMSQLNWTQKLLKQEAGSRFGEGELTGEVAELIDMGLGGYKPENGQGGYSESCLKQLEGSFVEWLD
jgi:hypothetical protein